ncbi:MAG: glycosyltransferase family 39 protein [Acidobacteriota bacterium]
MLRFYGLGEPQLWLDELIQISRSTQPGWEAILQDVRSETAAVPLDYLVQGLFVQTLGTSAWAARLHAALFGCLSLGVMYWLGARLLGPTARWGGLLSMFVLAFYPLQIFYSQEGRNYSLFFFCTLLSFALLVEALQRRSPRWWILHSAAVLGMLYSNYLGVLALAAQGAFVLLRPWVGTRDQIGGEKPLRSLWTGFALSASTAFLLFLPWLLQTYSQARDTFQEDFWSLPFVGRFIQESSGGSWPLSLLLITLAAAGLRSLRQRRAHGVTALLLCWLCLPVAAVLLLDWWRGYFFAARQILFASPPLLLAAAAGLAETLKPRQSRGRRGIAAAAVVLTAALGVGTVVLSSGKQPADWEALDRYLHTQVADTDRVAAPHIERPVAWRYPALNRRRAALDDLPPRSAWPGDSPRLHLIESRYTTWRQQRMIAEALAAAQSAETVEVGDFRVYLLAFP